MMNFTKTAVGFALMISGVANASTIFTATDGDVNFLFSPLPAGVTLYMFDDNDNNSFVSAASLLVNVPSVVSITGPVLGDYLAAGTLTLTATPSFVLAVWDAGLAAWVSDTNPVIYANANAAHLTFNTSGGVYVVDVVPSVPVPAAVWLFGSGLLGLIGIARKKAA